MIARHFRIWMMMAAMSLQVQLSYSLGSAGFLIGKLIRLLFFFAFVVAVFQHTEAVAGYSLVEMAVFFLTFNLVDMAAQILFRGIYGARRTVVEGDFDFYLVQPCSPLFRMLLTSVDFLDIVTAVPVLVLMGIVFQHLPVLPFHQYLLYLLLCANGVAIAMAIHVFVAGLAVRTQELENSIWLYRELMFMGKFPVDIYGQAARWTLTFVLPVAVMTTFPSQALLGVLAPAWAAYSFALGAVLLALSLLFWKGSVARYTSSSS